MRIVKGRIVETIYGIDIPWPEQPQNIEGGEFPVEEQYFRRTAQPAFMSEIETDEHGNYLYDDRQWAFIMREFERCFDTGYWFYNCGRATNITPFHYFYLNYARFVEGGHPEYRDMTRRYELYFDYFLRDSVTLGIIYGKKRRDGATHRSAARCLWMAYTHIGGHIGIQSMNEKDAYEKNFVEVVSVWSKLPVWLKPLHSGSDNPKNALEFKKPAEVRGRKNPVLAKSDAIGSKITYGPAHVRHYDGSKLVYWLHDEIGKTTEVDVYKRLQKVKLSLTTGAGSNKVGFSEGISTVEEITRDGGENFKRIWEDCDIENLGPLGQTITGSRRIFFPAYDGLENFIGKYGESIIEPCNEQQAAFVSAKFKDNPSLRDNILKGAKQFLEDSMAHAKKAKDSHEAVASLRRTYPITEDDMFISMAGGMSFNMEHLEIAEKEARRLADSHCVIGDLIWQNGKKDTKVVFVERKGGPFRFEWRFHDEKDPDNNVEIATTITEADGDVLRDRNIFKPSTNRHRFIVGVDPYEVDTPRHGQGSLGAIWVRKKHDAASGEKDRPFDDTFVCRYLHRRQTAKEFWEDIIKLAVYFGCQIFGEDKNRGWLNYIHERKYSQFLLPTLKDVKPGRVVTDKDVERSIAASKSTNIQIAELWQWEIENNWQSLRDLELIQQLKAFDVNDTEKFDAVMASGYALIAQDRIARRATGSNTRKKSQPLLQTPRRDYDLFAELK